MICKLTTSEIFIPLSYGNATDPKPVRFHIKYLSVAEKTELGAWYVPSKITKRGVTMQFQGNEAFTKSVTLIDNLTVEIDGVDKSITTAEEFASLIGFEDMYSEVILRIQKSSEIEKKT